MPKSWMIDNDDPARLEIVERAKELGITGNPGKAVHALGEITLVDKRVVNAYVLHAVDPVITDYTNIVMINRLHDPGKGKPALPGGLIDPTEGGGVETAIQAGVRELLEEVGIDIKEFPAILIGERNMDRPFDVRVAQGNGLEEKYGIKDGDVFMVSTQTVRFYVSDLSKIELAAGDDAEPGTARRVKINTLTKESVGIPDHFDQIVAAFPEHFIVKETGSKNPDDIEELVTLDRILKENAFTVTVYSSPEGGHCIQYSYGSPFSEKGKLGSAFRQAAEPLVAASEGEIISRSKSGGFAARFESEEKRTEFLKAFSAAASALYTPEEGAITKTADGFILGKKPSGM